MRTKMMILGMGLLASTTALAGGKTFGGGQTVPDGDRPSLRDLQDKTTCYWQKAPAFMTAVTHWPRIMESISRHFPYWAKAINAENQVLKICRTDGPLVQIPAEELGGLTIVTQNARQVAIRWNDSVYLDMSQFAQMDEVNKAYLMLHETLHTFLPMDLDFRNTKLRSLVKMIRMNELNPMSQEDFAYQFEQSGATFDHKATNYGFVAQDYRDLGLTTADLADVYTCWGFKDLGFTPPELALNFECNESLLTKLGYTKEELLRSGMTARQLGFAGLHVLDLKNAGFSLRDMYKAGNFAYPQFREAGYTTAELKAEGFIAPEVSAAGFSVREVLQAGFTLADVATSFPHWKRAFDTETLKAAGFTAKDLVPFYRDDEYWTIQTELVRSFHEPSDLQLFKQSGFRTEALRNAGVDAGSLLKAGYSKNEVMRLGYGRKELLAAGFSLWELRHYKL